VNVNEWIKCVIAGERATHALVLEGGRGSGKGVAVRLLETLIPGRLSSTILMHHIGRANFNDAATRAVTELDLVAVDEVSTMEQVERIKYLVSAANVDVDVKGRGREIRTVKANIIVNVQFWPTREAMDRETRFIVTSPIAFIAELIPFFAR
jgi:hypothetical protein